MTDVLVTTGFGEALLDRIRAVSPALRVTRGEAGRADYADVEVLYATTLPADAARAPRLRWVQLHMAGPDSIHGHPLYTDSTVALTTTSGVHAGTIAEYAITVLLALAHRVPRMVEWKARGGWPPDAERWPLFVPTEIRGATLGLVGYGSIGRELARIAKTAFGMTVLACKRDPARRRDPGYCRPGTGDPEGVLPDGWYGPDALHELLGRSDAVVMCAPLTRETRAMFDAEAFGAMRPSAYFVNVGRGGSVDEAALVDALRSGTIAGAAIDVFAQEPPPMHHPLYALDNVIVSPHVSGFLTTYDEHCTDLFVENLRRYLAGQPLLNLVDRAVGY
jgi:phosphoglycerate dehydrogenase-like enzyme